MTDNDILLQGGIEQSAYVDILELDLMSAHGLVDLLAAQVVALGGTPRMSLTQDERHPGRAVAEEVAELRTQFAGLVNAVSTFSIYGLVPAGVPSWEAVVRQTELSRGYLTEANVGWATLEKRNLVNTVAAAQRALIMRLRAAIAKAEESFRGNDPGDLLATLEQTTSWIDCVSAMPGIQLIDHYARTDDYIGHLIKVLDRLFSPAGVDIQPDDASRLMELLKLPIADEWRGLGISSEKPVDPLKERHSIDLGDGYIITLRGQHEAKGWVVLRDGYVLNHDEQWEREHNPSREPAGFQTRTRWETLDDAYAAADAVIQKGNAC